MCFSATASFALSGMLISAGAYAISKAQRSGTAWIPFAIFPLAFGIQQGIEGFVWLGMNNSNEALISMASRGYLFFSHFFWLAWVPFSVWMIEQDKTRRRLAAALTAIGFFYGLSVFMPSFIISNWLEMEMINRSLGYKTTLIYDGYINRTVLRLFYAAIVISALFLSTDNRIRIFGIMVTLSLAFTYAFFAYAFISVWCFFAAILSAYLVWVMVLNERRKNLAFL